MVLPRAFVGCLTQRQFRPRRRKLILTGRLAVTKKKGALRKKIAAGKPVLGELFQLLRESTRQLAASIINQSRCSKVYFDKMQVLVMGLLPASAITGKNLRGLFTSKADWTA